MISFDFLQMKIRKSSRVWLVTLKTLMRTLSARVAAARAPPVVHAVVVAVIGREAEVVVARAVTVDREVARAVGRAHTAAVADREAEVAREVVAEVDRAVAVVHLDAVEVAAPAVVVAVDRAVARIVDHAVVAPVTRRHAAGQRVTMTSPHGIKAPLKLRQRRSSAASQTVTELTITVKVVLLAFCALMNCIM